MRYKLFSLLTLAAFLTTASYAGDQAQEDAAASLATIATSLGAIDNSAATDGSATPTTGTLVVGQDGTNAQSIKTDTSGELQVDVLSAPAIAAGTALIGKISASGEVSTIYDGSTALTPKFAFVNVAASQTDSAIVAAIASKKIRVIGIIINTVTIATPSSVTFTSKPGGAGAAISPAIVPNSSFAAYSPVGFFQTVAGEGLSVTTSAGSTSGIQVVYVEV